MEFLSEGIGVLDDMYLRTEELIDLAEKSNSWRPGTAGQDVKPDIRVTEIYDINPKNSKLESELFQELIDMFLMAINKYGEKFSHLKITKGENLRVIKYKEGGFYKSHIDSHDNKRVISGILYLNTDVEGGHIYFPNQKLQIQPRAGRLLLFPSNFMFPHESKPVTKGTKYALVGWFS